MSGVSAHPFLIQSFGQPTAVVTAGEFCAVANARREVFITRCQKIFCSLTDKDKNSKPSAPLTKLTLKLFAHPMLVGVSGSSEVTLCRNKEFQVVKLPCFLMAKSVAIVSSSLVIVCDSSTALFWDLSKNKCSLCFSSQTEILDVFVSTTGTLVLTSDGVNLIERNGNRTRISVNLTGSFIRTNANMTRYLVLMPEQLCSIHLLEKEGVQCAQLQVPPNCCDICVVGDDIVGLFEPEPKKKVLRIEKSGAWGDPVEVPGIDFLCGSSCFALAFSAQFTLILHQLPKLFDPFASSVPLFNDAMIRLKSESGFEVANVLLMFYGLDLMIAAVGTGNKDCEKIVDFVLNEVWNRGIFREWCNIAKKWPRYIKNQRSADRIIQLLNSKDVSLDHFALCPFAGILQATGHPQEAFDLYLRAKNGESVTSLLPAVIETVEERLTSLIDLCLDLLREGKSHLVTTILGILSYHSEIIKPETVIRSVMFSWDLIDIYYQSFDELPKVVANAYVNALAIYQPSELLSYLQLSTDYDIEVARDLLLKLGRIDEYEYLLSISNIPKYLELLVIREEWETLFKFLSIHRRHWTCVLRMMVYNSEYFLIFVQHLSDLRVTVSELVSEIPKECPAKLLARGFRYLADETAARHSAARLVQSICSEEAFAMFDQLLKTKTGGTVIEL